MALSVKLEFRQSQSLVMTPQLQQAIKLLQLSNLELNEFVDAELERNPLLERKEQDEGEALRPHKMIALATSVPKIRTKKTVPRKKATKATPASETNRQL